MAARKPSAANKAPVSASTQARILAGAEQVFGELGYAQARVEDILAAAGTSRPTFYKVYASKEAVLEALSERHHHEIQQRIRQAVDSSESPVLKLVAMVEAFLRWRAGLGVMGRALDVEARTPGSGIAPHRRKTLRAMARFSSTQLRAAGRADVDPVLIGALIAALENVADALLVEGTPTEATFARARAIALRIVAASLGQPGDPVLPIPKPP